MATYPQKMGRYTLERRLAAGGMAEVFLARQSGPEGFEKVCVVKRMLPHLSDDETFVNMFLDEARLAARLTHPNVAQIFDFGRNEDTYYLAMEYVQGSNLHAVVDDHARRSAKMAMAPVLRITALACAGLDFAHNATDDNGEPLHIIHRDISPHNIMLSKNGDVKLIDFGIAKAATGLHLTKAGTLKGKYAYMAPEQVKGQPLDKRTDIYAMGLVLWELLSNRPAIVGDSEATLMGKAAARDFDAIEKVRPEVPTDVRKILERSLALDMKDRYDNAGQMADDLEDFLARSGTRVRQSELAALLHPSLQSTNVGQPSSRALATPAVTAVDAAAATNVAPLREGNAPTKESVPIPALKPTVEQRVSKEPLGAVGPPVPTLVDNESPKRRTGPALAAIGLLMAASGATVFAYLKVTGAKPSDELVVPPPPTPVAKPPEPVVAKPPEPVPVAKPPEQPEPAPAPVEPVRTAKSTKPPKEKHPKEKEPKPVATAKEPAQPPPQPTPAPTPGGKGTVVIRVLPYAEVYRDGTSLGTTPLKPLELDPGKYSFRFVNPETKKSETKEVTVTSGGSTTVKVDLR